MLEVAVPSRTHSAPSTQHSALTGAVAALLFASGAAGLIYQVAWVRLLGLAFGVTVYAVSTVLAAFMGGLAIGSLVGGRRADLAQRPLRAYGLVELGVGLTALLTPWAFRLLQDIYAGTSHLADPQQAPLIAGGMRAVLTFAVLLVPTALMGATLPLAVRGLRRAHQSNGSDTTQGDAWAMSLLYATNTSGAIAGCLISGFVLIGRLGLSETIFAAALANAVAGLGALALDHAASPPLAPAAEAGPLALAEGGSLAAAEAGPLALAEGGSLAAAEAGPLALAEGGSLAAAEAGPLAAAQAGFMAAAQAGSVAAAEAGSLLHLASGGSLRRPQVSLDRRRHTLGRSGSDRSSRLAYAALIAFSVSGAISLAYEVVWTRVLAVLFDSSIYGFVLMLATVLAGIAIGGAIGGGLMRTRVSNTTAGILFAVVEVGIGLAAILALLAFGVAYDTLVQLRDHGPTLLARFVRTDLRLMAVLCVVTVLPAALLMGATFPVAARLWAAGEGGLGRRLGGIYAGNVAGAIVGSLLAGFVLVPTFGAHHSLLTLAAANVLVGAALLLLTRRSLALATGTLGMAIVGLAALSPPIHELVFRQHFPDQQLVAYWEGLENTVSVGRDASGVQTLFTNSRGQTNDSPDLVRYHRVMGHLAALLAPSRTPRALVVGLGAGATPGALAKHSGASIDVVELSESVIAAAPFFSAANLDVLQQPNVHLQIDDGRNYLLRNRLLYDVVTADVVHPYDAGANNLYSLEYFSAVARSLAPGGIMVQWVSPGTAFEHSLIVRTFLAAFPYAELWLGDDLLIGSTSLLKLSRGELETRLSDPGARASLAEVGFNHAQDVLAQFRGTSDQLHAYAGEGPILTDDHPILEYFQSQAIPQEPPDLTAFDERGLRTED